VSPVVFQLQGIQFHFFANEGTPREPIHIHASRAGARAKVWLQPDVSIAWSKGYDRREQTAIIRIVRQRRAEIENAWTEFFRNSG
jgi:hypothetical protein